MQLDRSVVVIDREALQGLNAAGLCDREIAERLGFAETSVKRVRRKLGLPAAVSPSERAQRMNRARWGASHAPRVAELARAGLGDAAIAAMLGSTPKAIASARFRLAIRAGKAKLQRVPFRRDHQHEHAWAVARPRARKRHIEQHRLDAIRDTFLRGQSTLGDGREYRRVR
ncbi:MAG TPA: hypothetical protein VGG74_14795 [Kofleriaceae bacterium]